MKNIDTKKIIIFLIIIGIFGLSIIWFFSNKQAGDKISENGLGTFFPFEEGGDVDLGKDQDWRGSDYTTDNDQIIDGEILPLLRQITSEPVAGAILFHTEKMEKGEYIIRYMEKATGHIYETSTKTLTVNRLSNITIPKIHTAVWLNGESFLVRYLDDNETVKTFSAKLVANDLGEQTTEGVFLQDNIKEVVQFDEKIFYLLEGEGGSIGIISDPNGDNKKHIFNSPLKEWLIAVADNQNIAFTTKTALGVRGLLFLFNPNTKSFNKILGDKLNLSTLTNNLSDILYFENGKLGPKLSVYNNKNKISAEFPVISFPEKCVWANDNIYIYCGVPQRDLLNKDLDAWYKGRVSFSDDIWKINTGTNTAEFLISPEETGVAGIDIIKPSLSKNEEYLLFQNKKDFSLWSLRLSLTR